MKNIVDLLLTISGRIFWECRVITIQAQMCYCVVIVL